MCLFGASEREKAFEQIDAYFPKVRKDTTMPVNSKKNK